MHLKTMDDLLTNQLKELHAAEKHSSVVYPELADAATDQRLQELFREEGERAKTQMTRIVDVLEELGVNKRIPANAESQGTKGVCGDCIAVAHVKHAEPHVRDAALIGMAQHLEHDQIAGYGCARTWSSLMGQRRASELLQRTLNEEHNANTKMTKLAETLNKSAFQTATA